MATQPAAIQRGGSARRRARSGVRSAATSSNIPDATQPATAKSGSADVPKRPAARVEANASGTTKTPKSGTAIRLATTAPTGIGKPNAAATGAVPSVAASVTCNAASQGLDPDETRQPRIAVTAAKLSHKPGANKLAGSKTSNRSPAAASAFQAARTRPSPSASVPTNAMATARTAGIPDPESTA